jgi:trehalose 6-phosphate synthase
MNVPGTNSSGDHLDNSAANGHEEREALIATTLNERPLIVASNRGPVTFTAQDGGFLARQGSGGLVTAVSAVLQDHQAIWIAAAMTEGDRKRAAIAEQHGEALITPEGSGSRFKLRFVVPDPDAYHMYYNVISNPLLWFLQHYLWDTPRSPDITDETWTAWTDGYEAVNRQYAEEIVRICEDSKVEPIIMLQDYHLYLTPGFIREARPQAIIQHFVHIPWPDPDYWRLLPMTIRRQICEGMLGNDVIGFQTRDHARSFMYTCESYIPGVQIDYSGRGIIWNGRRIEVRAYPISIDVEAVRRQAYGREALNHERYLPNYLNEFTILRVDRVEPSKNLIRGFHAFGRFLEKHPEYLGRVSFVAIMVPSRMEVLEYTNYLDDVSAIVVRLNAQYANVETGWQPIHLILGENYPRALAAMKRYDVLLVNTIIDGMNLVAKEGVLLNDRNGVLILSEGAGAVQQLGDDALIISPADIEGTADAIYQALTMSPSERRRRADNLRRTVESDDVAKWFREQLWDLVRYGIRKEHDPGATLPDGSVSGEAVHGNDSSQARLHVIVSPISPDQNGDTT